MIIRNTKSCDIPKLKVLHGKYFSDHEMINFDKLLCGFTILDKDDEIIIAGGIKPIAETLLITDKSKNVVSIGRALIEAQKISYYTCNKFKIDELNAFVMKENEDYIKHLVRHGFNRRDDQISLRMKVNG